MSGLCRSSCRWLVAAAKPISPTSTTARRAITTISSRIPLTTTSTRSLALPRRSYASEQKPKSASAEFYKTFGRPIAKVFLLAIFTYQVVYYFWVRLEQDETKRDMQATISDLETRISELERSNTQK